MADPTDRVDGQGPTARGDLASARRALAALRRFVRVLETVDARSRHAAIGWLADTYLGVQVYDCERVPSSHEDAETRRLET